MLNKFSKIFFASTLCLPVALAETQFNLPDLGDVSSSTISNAQEKQIGQKFMQQARQTLPYISDPEVEEYLAKLGKSLTDNLAPSERIEFNFYLVNSPQINAFAVPGGYITIYAGLFNATKNESELASVLAHEISHVTQKHIPRMIARNKQLAIPSAAALIGGLLIGGQAGAAAVLSTNASLIENQLTYSRDFESEADNIGIQLLAKSNFDVQGMPSFFNTLQSKTRLTESLVPEYLRTHPLTINRITDTQARANRQTTIHHRSSKDYLFMREKIRAYSDTDNIQRLISNYQAEIKSANDKSLSNSLKFGYAYALMNNQKYSQALDVANKLVVSSPNTPYVDNLIAQIYFSMGEQKKAISTLKKSVEKYANNHSLKKDYADILIKTQNNQLGIDILKPIVKNEPDNSYLIKILAQAYGSTGDKYNAHLLDGDYKVLFGRYDAAIKEYEKAKTFAYKSFYKKAIIDAKISESHKQKELSKLGSL